MDRYRVSSNFNGVSPRIPSYLTDAPSQISLLPKPHLEDIQIFPYLSPDTPKLPGDCVVQNADDTEISIFDAERYFNGKQDSKLTSKEVGVSRNEATENCGLSLNQREHCVPSIEGFSRNFGNRSFRTTPTVSSEASWNSQARLLRKSQCSNSVGVRSFVNGELSKEQSSPGRRFFSYRCPCYGKKSVDVKEKDTERRSSIPPYRIKNNSSISKMPRLEVEGLARNEEVEQIAKMNIFPGIPLQNPEIFRAHGRFSLDHPFPAPEMVGRAVDSGGFSFPVLVPGKGNASKNRVRVSLEVFQPTETATPLKKPGEFQKSMYARDAVDRRSFTFPGSPKMRSAVDDDAASDTSSDLFEIESLSTQMGLRRRDSLDELPSILFGPRNTVGISMGIMQSRRAIDDDGTATPSIAPSECYPPSEVSVDWSVVTAEGFDRSSVANFSSAVSEYGELRHETESLGRWKKKGIGGGGGSSGLLSCRSEKAANVIRPKPACLGPETQRRLETSNSMIGLDRAVSVVRLGGDNPVHDGSGALGMSGQSPLLDRADKD